MKIRIEYTDTHVSVEFVEDCAGLWGLYKSTREAADHWLRKGLAACEDRFWDVCTGGAPRRRFHPDEHDAAQHNRDIDTLQWLMTECPPVAKAIMCGEWDG